MRKLVFAIFACFTKIEWQLFLKQPRYCAHQINKFNVRISIFKIFKTKLTLFCITKMVLHLEQLLHFAAFKVDSPYFVLHGTKKMAQIMGRYRNPNYREFCLIQFKSIISILIKLPAGYLLVNTRPKNFDRCSGIQIYRKFQLWVFEL